MKSRGVSFRHAVELLKADPSSAASAAPGAAKRSKVRALPAPVAFDASDQALVNQTITDGEGHSVSYAYDAVGRLEPDATGLVFYRARYYHPGIGRFASRDPAGMADAVSPYAYVRNNPVGYVDPFGLAALSPEYLQQLISNGSYVDRSTGTDIACAPACVGLGTLPGRGITPPPSGTPGYQGLQGRSVQDDILTTPATSNDDSGSALGVFIDGALQGLRTLITTPGKAWENFRNNVFGGPIFSESTKPSTLQPGPYAGQSIPGHAGPPTPQEQERINEIGRTSGCPTCGTIESSTTSGNFIVDHQPPSALGEPTEFYPHCIDCMRRQGGEVRQELRNRQK